MKYLHARSVASLAPLGLGLFLAGCPTPPGADAGPDGSHEDAGDAGPRTIRELPSQPPQRISGLDGEVDVVVDRWGWPHIYATTLRDAMFVQGVLVARDRMPQMEMIRRVASGTLAEAFGGLSATVIERDLAQRVIGLRRAAQLIWDATPPGRSRTALEAFSAGVNQYLGDIRNARQRTPNGTELVVTEFTPDWTPVDSLTIARFQSFSLSYDADRDIEFSAARDRSREVFDNADPVTAAELNARRGWFWDMHRFASPSTATAVPEFYSRMMGVRYVPEGPALRTPRRVTSDAMPFVRAIRENLSVIARADRGSNNWVVAGTHSRSGHALLANDPHLSLTGPAVWWGAHITVTQGPDAVDVAGVSFPGIPGIVLGYNNRIAWGATVAEFDVADAYLETITPGAAGAPDTVRFNGADVPIQVITEQVPNGTGGFVAARIEIVPHHGPIVPTISMGRIQPRTGSTAISIKWTGMRASHELNAFIDLWYANNVAEARTALNTFGVGAQNFVIADIEGHIGYTTHADVPVREPAALNWNATTGEGNVPCGVLPGTGGAEWTGFLDPSLLPNALGGADHPWLATANNDQVGLTLDNNPFNDRVFLTCHAADGFRAERIQQRLTALGTTMSREDMESIQNDHFILGGARLRPFLAQAMTRLEQEWATPGMHPDLAALAVAAMPRQAALRDAATRMADWTLDSPSGLEYDLTERQRRDASTATIFHVWASKMLIRAFSDEGTALGVSTASNWVRSALFLLEHPDQARTLDPRTGQSAIWDDLSTTTVRETRDAIIIKSFDETIAALQARYMTSEIDRWTWGTIHTVRFESIVPGPGAGLSVPPMNDPMFPTGFPRPGGYESVDVANPGINGNLDFSFASGASQRFTVEMDPAGPRGFNALPGGQAFNTQSRHHRDEADQYWQRNLTHPVPRSEAEVVAYHESRLRFAPMP